SRATPRTHRNHFHRREELTRARRRDSFRARRVRRRRHHQESLRGSARPSNARLQSADRCPRDFELYDFNIAATLRRLSENRPRELRLNATRTVLSGLSPTCRVHLGNYFGAVKNWVDLQEQYDAFYFVAD